MHCSITNTFSTIRGAAAKCGTAQSQVPFPGIKGATIADDFKFLVKVSDKGFVERFRGMEPQKILQEINKAIEADPNISKIFSSSSDQLFCPELSRILALKHLQNGDFELHTRKVEDVGILHKSNKWIKIFDGAAIVFEDTYRVLVHAIRTKSMPLKLSK